MQSSPILSACGLVKTYESVDPAGAKPGQFAVAPALAGVNLDVARGRSLAIVGPSGSGKTTLLHTLSGILTPTAGSVIYNGPSGPVQIDQLSDSARSALRRSQSGFVFQQGLLLDELTALENVAIALMMTGVSRRLAETEARAWLASLGLAGLENRRLGQMSGGQAQRVAIARAQVTGAPLLFADEPTGSLDSHTGDEVFNLLLGTVAAGRTLVLVTHNLDLAARCDRVVTLSDGRIVGDTDILLPGGTQPRFATMAAPTSGTTIAAPVLPVPVADFGSGQAATARRLVGVV